MPHSADPHRPSVSPFIEGLASPGEHHDRPVAPRYPCAERRCVSMGRSGRAFRARRSGGVGCNCTSSIPNIPRADALLRGHRRRLRSLRPASPTPRISSSIAFRPAKLGLFANLESPCSRTADLAHRRRASSIALRRAPSRSSPHPAQAGSRRIGSACAPISRVPAPRRVDRLLRKPVFDRRAVCQSIGVLEYLMRQNGFRGKTAVDGFTYVSPEFRDLRMRAAVTTGLVGSKSRSTGATGFRAARECSGGVGADPGVAYFNPPGYGGVSAPVVAISRSRSIQRHGEWSLCRGAGLEARPMRGPNPAVSR
jgi:hypothetical protein